MKTFLYLSALILGLLASAPVFADTLSANKDAEFGLNRASPEAMRKYLLGSRVVRGEVRTLRAIYDFSTMGGAISTITLKSLLGQPVVIPNKAIVIGCIIDVLTPATTSASGTIAIGTGQATNDLKTATAAASYTGLVACTPVGTAATSIKMTGDRTITASIATGAITAGKFSVIVQYVLGDY